MIRTQVLKVENLSQPLIHALKGRQVIACRAFDRDNSDFPVFAAGVIAGGRRDDSDIPMFVDFGDEEIGLFPDETFVLLSESTEQTVHIGYMENINV